MCSGDEPSLNCRAMENAEAATLIPERAVALAVGWSQHPQQRSHPFGTSASGGIGSRVAAAAVAHVVVVGSSGHKKSSLQQQPEPMESTGFSASGGNASGVAQTHWYPFRRRRNSASTVNVLVLFPFEFPNSNSLGSSWQGHSACFSVSGHDWRVF